MLEVSKSLTLPDGIELHLSVREIGAPIWLIGTHGVGEHQGRHKYLYDLFGSDFNILLYDLRGHGRSQGKRAFIQNFSTYSDDFHAVLEYLKTKYRMEKYVLYGHSMGALILSTFLQKYQDLSPYPLGVFLSAPPLKVPTIPGKILQQFPQLTQILLKSPLSIPLGGVVNLHNLSHDAQVYTQYLSDPLNSTKLHSQLLLGLLATGSQMIVDPLQAKCPVAMAVGGEDRVVSVDALKRYCQHPHVQVPLKIIDGAFHEMHNEVARYRQQYFEYLKHFFEQFILNLSA